MKRKERYDMSEMFSYLINCTKDRLFSLNCEVIHSDEPVYVDTENRDVIPDTASLRSVNNVLFSELVTDMHVFNIDKLRSDK